MYAILIHDPDAKPGDVWATKTGTMFTRDIGKRDLFTRGEADLYIAMIAMCERMVDDLGVKRDGRFSYSGFTRIRVDE